MLISFLFQMIVMARVERGIGSLRIMFIYIGSGIIGTLASCGIKEKEQILIGSESG
jgi:membrane associated rhomboid family serine protease